MSRRTTGAMSGPSTMSRIAGDRIALLFALALVVLLAFLVLGEGQAPGVSSVTYQLMWSVAERYPEAYPGYCPLVSGAGWDGRLTLPTGSRALGYSGGFSDTASRSRPHTGLDFPAAPGTPVRAAEAGTVVWAGRSIIDPVTIVLAHGGGYTTVYAHLSAVGVACGQTVSAGQEIGASGEKVYPHLHFMLTRDQQVIDPEPYFPTSLVRLSPDETGWPAAAPGGQTGKRGSRRG